MPEKKGDPKATKLCPECLGRGKKSKVKTYQINLEGEGVVMCGVEACSWPFTSESLVDYLVAGEGGGGGES